MTDKEIKNEHAEGVFEKAKAFAKDVIDMINKPGFNIAEHDITGGSKDFYSDAKDKKGNVIYNADIQPKYWKSGNIQTSVTIPIDAGKNFYFGAKK